MYIQTENSPAVLQGTLPHKERPGAVKTRVGRAVSKALRSSPISVPHGEVTEAVEASVDGRRSPCRVLLPFSGSPVGKGSSCLQIPVAVVAVSAESVDVHFEVIPEYPLGDLGNKARVRDNAIVTKLQELEVVHPNIQEKRLILIGRRKLSSSELQQCDLARALCNFKLSKRSKLNVLIALFKAVVYLHEKGICHADLKPDNVLLTVDPAEVGTIEEEHVRLTDFGEAKFFCEGEERQAIGIQEQAFCKPEKSKRQGELARLAGNANENGLITWLEHARRVIEEPPSGLDDFSDELRIGYEFSAEQMAEDQLATVLYDAEQLHRCFVVLGDCENADRLGGYRLSNDTRDMREMLSQHLDDEAARAELSEKLDLEHERLSEGFSEEQLKSNDAYSLGVMLGLIMGCGIPRSSKQVAERIYKSRSSTRPLVKLLLGCAALPTESTGDYHDLVVGLCEGQLSVAAALSKLEELRQLPPTTKR